MKERMALSVNAMRDALFEKEQAQWHDCMLIEKRLERAITAYGRAVVRAIS
jgi:hypothetical protein